MPVFYCAWPASDRPDHFSAIQHRPGRRAECSMPKALSAVKVQIAMVVRDMVPLLGGKMWASLTDMYGTSNWLQPVVAIAQKLFAIVLWQLSDCYSSAKLQLPTMPHPAGQKSFTRSVDRV